MINFQTQRVLATVTATAFWKCLFTLYFTIFFISELEPLHWSAGVRFFFYWTSLPGHTVGLCVSLTASCVLHTLALRDKNTWSVFISKNWSHQIGFTRWKDHRWNIVWPLEKSLVVKLDNITVKLLHNNHTKRQSPNKNRVYINWKSKPLNARILLFQIWRF